MKNIKDKYRYVIQFKGGEVTTLTSDKEINFNKAEGLVKAGNDKGGIIVNLLNVLYVSFEMIEGVE